MFVFEITYCCFNFYSSFKVLFIADAKISFDSFRSGMAATVNSKTIITVNPGKTLQLVAFTLIAHLHKKKTQTLFRETKPSDFGVQRRGKKHSSSCCCVEYLKRGIHVKVNHNLLSDTREASLLFSYAKQVSESGALDLDEKPEDVPGGLQ